MAAGMSERDLSREWKAAGMNTPIVREYVREHVFVLEGEQKIYAFSFIPGHTFKTRISLIING